MMHSFSLFLVCIFASQLLYPMLPPVELERRKENMPDYEFALSEQSKQYQGFLDSLINAGENMLAYSIQQSGAVLYSPVNLYLPWHDAAKVGDCERLTLLLANGGLEFRNKKGETPLHCAAAAGKFEAVKCLVEMGAYVNALDKTGRTPLEKTSIVEIRIYLRSHGAKEKLKKSSVLLRCMSDLMKRGGTPLHWLVAHNDVNEIKKLIARGVPLNVFDSENWTPLQWAIMLNHLNLWMLLVGAGALSKRRFNQ